jgi:hypothetical protein
MQELDVGMARILPDRLHEIIDSLLVALERLQEGLVAIEQHTGHAITDIIFQALLHS